MPPGRTASWSQSGMPCCGAEPAGAPAILTQRAARGKSGRLWRRCSRACRRRLMSGKLSLPSGMVFSQQAERRGLARLGASRVHWPRSRRHRDTSLTPVPAPTARVTMPPLVSLGRHPHHGGLHRRASACHGQSPSVVRGVNRAIRSHLATPCLHVSRAREQGALPESEGRGQGARGSDTPSHDARTQRAVSQP